MEFEAEVTKKEFKRFHTTALKRVAEQRKYKRKLNVISILYWIPLGIAAGAISHFYQACGVCDLGQLNTAIVFLGVWIVAGLVMQKWHIGYFIDHAVSDNGTILGNIKFRLDDGGITETGKSFKNTFAWQSIQTVKMNEECIFLFTDLIKAVIVPTSQLTKDQVSELAGILNRHTDFMLKV